MRIIPTLALVVFLIPTLPNAGQIWNAHRSKDDVALCSEQCELIREAVRQSDVNGLRSLLSLDGVTVGSVDHSVSLQAMQQAAEEWNRALGSPHFRLSNPGEIPTVSVHKVNGITGNRDLQGLIEVDETDKGLVSAKVWVDRQCGGRDLTDREVGAVLTHELGHFLGLDDIPNGTGVMGEYDPKHIVVTPSQKEVRAVSALRDKVQNTIAEIDGYHLNNMPIISPRTSLATR